ncbi:Fructose-1,6-bisphosphatase, cytosolic [Zancudomyces culisetae]|uniref:Fructose-1,6-bisphosphatase n=1 Tax=Zancudomyces culisetae TaxID=1213189 RepID=A0A1R1PEY0_ZANCU|nr:Fructose-1,6-bisphosphatase, cytosolic [Zancudomyces culisetae]|eukprot:OMH79524.1 Fructose-1,6-bisphosphatase, cytosolic [Zancudomyces culisetae]
MYGSSCNLVITLGNNNVNGFTLNPSLGEFILTHPNIRTPEHGDTYSINEGKYTKWDEATKAYIDFLKLHQEGGKTYASRYIGSMVADVHRTLMSGGIFAYPVDSENTNGKLRTLYESFPMAFLCEQAGGKATTGAKRVLDIVPRSIHDRCPIFLGSKENVETVEEFFEIYSNNLTSAFR